MRSIHSVLAGLSILLATFVATPAFAQLSDDYGIAAAGTYCPTLTITMQKGARDASTGGQVSELQKFLADYYDIDPVELVSGYFGRITQGYVIKFQQEQRLPAYGIAGSMTRARIASVCTQTGGANSIPTTPINTTNTTPSAMIDPSSLYVSTAKDKALVTITGSASNVSGITLGLKGDTGGSSAVTNGRWSVTIPSSLPTGTYAIQITNNANGSVLTMGTLVVNANGTINQNTPTVQTPSISISASSVAISPAMSFSVQYNNMPAAGVSIINSAGATVWTQELTSGGGGSTVVSLSTVLPAGYYTARAFGSSGAVYATSAAYYFAPPTTSCTYTSNNGQSRTATVSQSNTQDACRAACTSLRNEVFGSTDSGICLFKDLNGNATSMVIVVAPPSCTVTATNPYTSLPPYGQVPVTLSWTSTGATSGVMVPRLIYASTDSPSIVVSASGSMVVNPTDSSKYTFTFSGPSGVGSCDVLVGLKG